MDLVLIKEVEGLSEKDIDEVNGYIKYMVESIVKEKLRKDIPHAEKNAFRGSERQKLKSIGERLNDLAGMSLMQAVHSSVVNSVIANTGFGMTCSGDIDLTWSGIGDWRG